MMVPFHSGYSRTSMAGALRHAFSSALLVVSLLLRPSVGSAAEPAKDALPLLKTAVQTELDADQNDRSRWRFYDEQKELNDSVSIVVQTDGGSVKRLIARGGKPLTEEQAKQEDERLRRFIHDPAKMAKQRKDGQADDKSARDLLTMMPEAFLWTIKGQNKTTATLHFEPNPEFKPPSFEARVLAAMNGTVVIDKAQHRIVTLSGSLTNDVTFGFGVFGRLRKGGTFRVERRQLAPGLWQITETHVHIDGKALLFKSIGQQQDEIQTSYTPVPHGTTLDQAFEMSRERR